MQKGVERGVAVGLAALLALSSCATFSRSREKAEERFAQIYAVIGQADSKFDEADYRGAMDLYQRALIEMEEFADTYPGHKPEYIAYKRGECVDKIERAAARLGPREQREIEGRRAYLQAVEILRQEGPGAALEKLKKALEVSPDFFDAHWMIGNVYERLDRDEEALAAYRKAGEIDPSNPLPHQSMGELYESMGKYAEALEEFKKAIQADPSDVAPYIYASWVYINMGDLDEALAVSGRALEIDPRNKVVRNNIGLIYQKMEKLDDAIDAYRRAILEDPKYISPYQNLALVYALQGRHAESIDQYKQVLELDPENASAHFNLGINYKRMKKKLMARYHLEQAARLYGRDTEDGKKALAKIEELDSQVGTASIINLDR